jgi:hypothetical protein
VKPEGDESQDEASQSEKVLEEALARFKLAETAEQDIRRDALEDMKFAAGDQWDPQVRASRELKRRPCLTINRLPQFIRQVTNDQRQNRPSIKAHPVDDQGDIETAKVIQGIIRHIEYNSNADTARDTAFEGAVRGGFGYYRVVTQYESPTSFNQEILTKRIRNPMAVFFDPNSTEPDGSDANFAFVVETLSKEDFKRQYPKAKLSQSGEWETIGNDPSGWMEGNTCRVAEYFYKEYREATLVQLAGGEVVEESKLQEFAEKSAMRTGMSPELTVVGKRQTQIPSVRWCKLTLNEILEETDWPGIYIPIIPVYGEELVIDGKRILKGIIRDAKDSQRMLNVWKSAETETIGLAPKAPWVADAKTIEGYEHIWQSANTESYSVLPLTRGPMPRRLSARRLNPPFKRSRRLRCWLPMILRLRRASMMRLWAPSRTRAQALPSSAGMSRRRRATSISPTISRARFATRVAFTSTSSRASTTPLVLHASLAKTASRRS